MGIRNSKTENMLITMAFETDCHVGPLGLLAMTGFFDSLQIPEELQLLFRDFCIISSKGPPRCGGAG